MGYKNFRKPIKRYKDIVNDLGDDRGTNAQPRKTESLNDGLNVMARKDMYKNSYTFRTDPYKEANQSTQVYDFISPYNKSVSPSYLGDHNLDGGYVSQYLSSTSTRLLDISDSVVAKLKLNYRFLNYKIENENVDNAPTRWDSSIHGIGSNPDGAFVTCHRGEMLLRAAYDAVNEAVSKLDATTFMTLHMCSDYAIATSLHIPNVPYVERYHGKGYTADTDDRWVYIYNDIPAIILITALQYQITLLNIVNGFNIQNKIKFYEGTVLNMQYDRETSFINKFYSQIMKSTFTTNLEAIVLAVKGEYVDADFIKTMNMVLNVVSRESKAMINPIKELVGCLEEPNYFALFSAVAGDATWVHTDKIFEHALLFDATAADGKGYYYTRSCVWLTTPTAVISEAQSEGSTTIRTVRCSDYMLTQHNIDQAGTITVVEEPIKMGAYTLQIAQDYSITGQLTMVRNNNQHTITDINRLGAGDYIAADTINITTAKGYYNKLEDYYAQLALISNRVKTSFPDFRTVLDKVSEIGLVTWTKGVQLNVNSTELNADIVNFRVISDIYKTLLSGPSSATFSDQTGRWTATTFWDLFDGIPAYDAISGGCFITYSGRNLDCNNNTESDLGYIPSLYNFDPDSTGDVNIYMSSRLGNLVTLNIGRINVEDDETLARLAILPSQDTIEIKIPTLANVQYSAPGTQHANEINSWLIRTLTQECGFCSVNNHIHVDDDIIALYPFEILNISKQMQAYSKATAVFRGTLDATPDIGFAGLTVNKGKN